jgi:uncharacterized SAM-binding protein YcdF (DUF218 family)
MRRLLRTVLLLLIILFVFGCFAGYLLVQDNAQRSEAIVVLDGGTDARYMKGLDLLRSGYGKVMFVNAMSDRKKWGRTEVGYAELFIEETAGDLTTRVKVCPIQQDSTRTETDYVARCLDSVGAHKALIVTSDNHTRRALSIFRKLKPGYEWSVAASSDPQEFGMKWWQHRAWAKTTLAEWQRTIWWNCVDRWR